MNEKGGYFLKTRANRRRGGEKRFLVKCIDDNGKLKPANRRDTKSFLLFSKETRSVIGRKFWWLKKERPTRAYLREIKSVKFCECFNTFCLYVNALVINMDQSSTSKEKKYPEIPKIPEHALKKYKRSDNNPKLRAMKTKSSTSKEKKYPKIPESPGHILKKYKRSDNNPELRAMKTKPSISKEKEYPKIPDIPEHILKKYKRSDHLQLRAIKTKLRKAEYEEKEKRETFAYQQAARSEVLLTEEQGFIEAEDEDHRFIKQTELVDAVDITTATKYFDLKLHEFGPYTIDYTRNGRFLLIGGKRGHLAAMDWMTKHLQCEINVMEEIQEICWLHQETMCAVAQKQWVYMYDNRGVEVHCIKKLPDVLRMEFLPYHFLLATSSGRGYLSWLDISIGKMVEDFPSKMGRLDVMCQNLYNATLVLGHSNGVSSMWSPTVKEPLMKMLCHGTPIRAVAVHPSGTYMATAAMDRSLKIWDIRSTYKSIHSYTLGGAASNLVFSQTGLLGASIGNVVEVYKDCCIKSVTAPTMRHRTKETIRKIKFCPYEDILGIGHNGGFTSIIIPGAGEPNYDALESNPFQTKVQRREAEVKALLAKIPYNMISLDPRKIAQIDIDRAKKKIEETKAKKFVKPPDVGFEKLEDKPYRKKQRNK